MSKYDKLWKHVSSCEREKIELSFDEIEFIAGIPIDHSFLKYEKELEQYGYCVAKISMKQQTITFKKL